MPLALAQISQDRVEVVAVLVDVLIPEPPNFRDDLVLQHHPLLRDNSKGVQISGH